MKQNNLQINLLKYKSFDAYLNSGEFARLSSKDQVAVYDYYRKADKIDAEEKREPLVHDSRRTLEDEPFEDLSILQPDGSRACVNWELDANGFQLVAGVKYK